MTNDDTKTGAVDRQQITSGPTYKVDDLAHKHGLTRAAARALIKEHGTVRATLDRAAEQQRRHPAH